MGKVNTLLCWTSCIMPEAVLEKELALAASAMDCLIQDSQPAVDVQNSGKSLPCIRQRGDSI